MLAIAQEYGSWSIGQGGLALCAGLVDKISKAQRRRQLYWINEGKEETKEEMEATKGGARKAK